MLQSLWFLLQSLAGNWLVIRLGKLVVDWLRCVVWDCLRIGLGLLTRTVFKVIAGHLLLRESRRLNQRSWSLSDWIRIHRQLGFHLHKFLMVQVSLSFNNLKLLVNTLINSLCCCHRRIIRLWSDKRSAYFCHVSGAHLFRSYMQSLWKRTWLTSNRCRGLTFIRWFLHDNLVLKFLSKYLHLPFILNPHLLNLTKAFSSNLIDFLSQHVAQLFCLQLRWPHHSRLHLVRHT